MAGNEDISGRPRHFHSSIRTGLWGMERPELAVAISGMAVAGMALSTRLGPGEGLFSATVFALFGLALSAVRIQQVSIAGLIGRLAAFAWRGRVRTGVAEAAAAGETPVFKVALHRSPYLVGSEGRQEQARRLSRLLDLLARSEPPTALAMLSTSRYSPGAPHERRAGLRQAEDAYAVELAEIEEALLSRACGPESYLVLLPSNPSACAAAIASGLSIAPELFAERLAPDGGDLAACLPREGRLRERFSSLRAGGEKLVIYSVARWPHRAGPGVFAHLLLNQSTRFMVAVLFEPTPPERLARVVRTRRTRLEADGRLGAEMGYLRGAQRQLLREALGEAESQVLAGRAGVAISALVLAWHLPGDRESLPAAFAMNGISLRREFGRQSEALAAILSMAGR